MKSRFRRATVDDIDPIIRLQGETFRWSRRAVATVIASGSMDVIVETGPAGVLTGVVFLLPNKTHYRVAGCFPVDIDLLTRAIDYRHDAAGYYVSVSDLETTWHQDLKRNGWTAIKALRRDEPDRDHYLFTYRGRYAGNSVHVEKS